MKSSASRFEAVEIPPRMKHLEKDRRGYPIPVIVQRGTEGRPHFTVNNEQVRQVCLERDLCAICGKQLFKARWFVGGPGSMFHPKGMLIDTGMHEECAHYALKVCPYLAAPTYSKRIDDATMTEEERVAVGVMKNPTMMEGRPDLFVAVSILKKNTHYFMDRMNLFIQYVKLDPKGYRDIEFWDKGGQLSREEGATRVAQYLKAMQDYVRAQS